MSFDPTSTPTVASALAVQDQDRGIDREPAADQHALLVAARERLHGLVDVGCGDLEVVDGLLRDLTRLVAVDLADASAQTADHCGDDVFANRLVEKEPFIEAIFGHIADPVFDGVGRCVKRDGLAAQAEQVIP